MWFDVCIMLQVIIDAIEEGDLFSVKLLINHGMDVNTIQQVSITWYCIDHIDIWPFPADAGGKQLLFTRGDQYRKRGKYQIMKHRI